jgi:tRNA A22 N-methylase
MEMKFHLVCMSSNCLKFSDRDVRTLKTIPGMGGYQLLEIQKQLQKYLKCSPEIVELLHY